MSFLKKSIYLKKRELPALFFICCVLGLSVLVSSCTKKESTTAAASAPLTEQQLVSKGKSVYLNNCIACHNADPAKDGAIGPGVSGSSLELLEARILFAKYPPGYTPKRNSGSMVALPHLKEDIPALRAYLNSGNP